MRKFYQGKIEFTIRTDGFTKVELWCPYCQKYFGGAAEDLNLAIQFATKSFVEHLENIHHILAPFSP